jgi:hypothetical protein
MYDTTKPASAPDNLTVVSVDNEPRDGLAGDAQTIIGASDDGRYVYMVVIGQLVRDAELLTDQPGIYLWHEGEISYIGRAPTSIPQSEIFVSGQNYPLNPRQARVTPDGKHLLFTSLSGTGLLGDDHGSCLTSLGRGCRQVYVYDAEVRELACVSCPEGRPATDMATTMIRLFNGGTKTSWHESTALTDDGSHAFFSTADPLVVEDVNGRVDAYEYDASTRTVRLLSSGTDLADSWFMDASANGSDAFIVTRAQLVGWDIDNDYDLYDARVGGGFPEPVRQVPCTADNCQGPLAGSPSLQAAASSLFQGSGNERGGVRRPKACRRGYVKKRVRGRSKCVKRRASRRARRATTVKRRGS